MYDDRQNPLFTGFARFRSSGMAIAYKELRAIGVGSTVRVLREAAVWKQAV